MKSIAAKTIDEYIQNFPKEMQSLLKELRKAIKEEAPGAEETISYQMPTFKLNGKYLVYFAAWKDHIALYPTASNLEAEIKEVSAYRTGKGTLQFPIDKPLPLDLIRKIVQFRVKENQERGKHSK